MSVWDRLSNDAQRTILALIVLSGGTAVGCGPLVCDPAPPPSVTPVSGRGSPSPLICDPPPPPRTVTPKRSVTPQIFDPPPPPSATRTPTRSMTPMVCDAPPPPTPTLAPTRTVTPMVCDPPPPPTQTRTSHVNPFPLPLAEIRGVSLVWAEGLTFAAETAWPGAQFRWTVSAGALTEADGLVTWHPPAQAGRYLLQVVADWGGAGLAVDAVGLEIRPEGGVVLS